MSRLEIELLGDVRFRFDGTPWRFTAAPKCLPLLALLLLDEEPQQRLAIATQLWPDVDERVARANMRRHLHALAQALPAIDGVTWIATTPTTVAWNTTAPARSDLREFLALSATATTQLEAAQLYRGELLSRNFDEAIVGPRERLASQHIALLADLSAKARSARNYQDAAGFAEAILEIDEWREDMVRTLMTSRNALGDRSGALATFERFARRLHDELRTEPMFETLALRDAILAGAMPTESDLPPPSPTNERLLVGRTSEIDSLAAYWLRAARGSGSTTFISGEAGIGKTRLSLELQRTVELQGGRAIISRTSKPESIPYQPIIEALRQAIPFIRREPRDDRWLAALLPFVPEIRRIGDDLGELAELEGSRARLRLHDAFARAFEACARIRPLTVIFEDVHFAQPDTIDAIGALAEAIPSSPILLVATYRSTEAAVDSPIRALRRRLARASLANHLSLGRLGIEDVRAIVTTTVTDAAAFADEVYALSEGNPLFAWQLIHDRTERGVEASSSALTVGDAILRRLDNVEPEVRVVAEVAATIGDTFTVEEIADVGGWDESRVFGSLARLLDRHIVAERAGASFEYGFTHALIGGAIYDATSSEARRTRHRRAADVLARTRTERGGVLPLVAQHWLRADEPARAREAFLAAARAALRAYARYDALAFSRRALDLDPPTQERFEALRILIQATDKFVDIDAAERALGEFETLAETLGRQEQYDALVTRILFHGNHAQRAVQEEVCERLVQFVKPSDPPTWRFEAILQRVSVRMQRGLTIAGEFELANIDYATMAEPRQRHHLHSMLAQSYFRQGRFDEGQAALVPLRQYLDEHPSVDGEWRYAYAAHKEAWMRGDSHDVLRSALGLVELARERGDLPDEAAGLMDVAAMRHQLHDSAAARRDYARTLDLWARARQWQGWANTMNNRGELESEIGHIDRAMACWRQAKQRGQEAGARFAPIVADMNMAGVEVLRGELSAALERAAALPPLVEDTGDTRTIGEVEATYGAVLCACGRYDEGLAKLQHALATLRTVVQGRWRATHIVNYINGMLASKQTADLPNASTELESIFVDDPHDQVSPGSIAMTMAAAARFTGSGERESLWLERGRDAVLARLDAFTDEDDRAAYAALPANRTLLAQLPVG